MSIIDYIKGKRKGKAANKLEREAMHDPFLQDALEGYDSMQGDHSGNIEKLQDQIRQLSSAKSRRTVFLTKKRVALAATFTVLIIGISFFMVELIDRSQPLLSISQRMSEFVRPDHLGEREDRIKIKDTILLADATSPKRQSGEKVSPAPVPGNTDIVDIYSEQYASQALPKTFLPEEAEMLQDTMMLAMDQPQYKDRKIEETLSNMQGVSSMDGEVTAVSVQRVERQGIAMDGIQAKKKSTLTDKNELEKYVMVNFNKNLCPEIKGKIVAKVSINEAGIPEVLEIEGTTCEDFKNELMRLLNETALQNMGGQKIKLNFKF